VRADGGSSTRRSFCDTGNLLGLRVLVADGSEVMAEVLGGAF
jgi:hypothetical protein